MIYKYFGLLSVALLIVGLAFVVWKWPIDKDHTFSQHVARRKSSIIYYAALFILTLPLFVLFSTQWFVPTFRISTLFNMLLIGSALAQIACTFVPEVGQKIMAHRILAGISGILLVPSLLLLLVAPVTHSAKIITVVGLIVMLCIIVLSARANGEPKHFLLLQIAYYLSFFVPVLYIAY